jgi:hypothetical protein
MEARELTASPAAAMRTARPGTGAAIVSALVVPLFAATMFVSGFLLFMVEPMAAKMVLPILGGVPMVWNGCVVFFQIVMLAGYGYAFGASRCLRLRPQVVAHAALLAAPIAVLPLMIQPGARPPDGNPLGWLLLLLAGTIGLPFFVLSTSASVFQHWLSRTDHPAARDPYFLYSSSNVGCLLALASYPTLVEPLVTLREQARLWTAGYAEFVLLAGACAFVAWRSGGVDRAAEPEGARVASEPIARVRRARWVALAFVPSSLMLAVTSYISTDIGAVPLLWIVPLSLYLMTFALAFGRHSFAVGEVARRALPLLVVPLALFMMVGVQSPLAVIVSLHLAAFAVIALHCHAELAQDRPEPARLTEFYFWLSFGGMLGGLFNALAAPLLFNRILEYPLVLLLACALFRPAQAPDRSRRAAADAIVPLVVAALTVGIFVFLSASRAPLAVQLPALAVPAFVTFTQRKRTIRFGACMAGLVCAGIFFSNAGERVLYATRTFFGVYRVSEDNGKRYHELVHGTTLHGLQALAPDRRGEALTYYHATGPFGQAWNALPRASSGRDIAVVGLGAGTLATYVRPGQHWTFFEVDPAVERIARTPNYFSFMETCGDRCRVVIGDARVSLGKISARSYDLLVLDAFSSDSIPMHLMTREAFELYTSRLRWDGVLVAHVSNRHLRLAPIVARLASSVGFAAVHQIESIQPGWPEGKDASHWIVMSRNRDDLSVLSTDARWSPLAPAPSTPLWTDDFSNILSVLNVR